MHEIGEVQKAQDQRIDEVQELRRHCEDEETKEAQESRIECFKQKGNQQFTEDGRRTEITIDLLLQAKAKLSDNKVTGPDDAIVSDMIKKGCPKRSTLLRGAFRNDSWA